MKRNISNTLWGLFFIAIGIGIAGNVMNLWDFNLFFRGWWTLLIIIPCFISMIQSGIGIGSLMGFLFGIVLLISYRVDLDFNIWKLIVPFILIYIGIRFLIQSISPRPKRNKGDIGKDNGGQNLAFDELPEYSSVFSSNKVNVETELYGLTANAIFGSLKLDLRNAIISQDVEIKASAIFGGIDIYIPDNVKIKTNNVPIFGGVNNKYRDSEDPESYTIYLDSTCMFGGIDIK